MLTISNITLALTATTTALIAGLFYAYSCSVNPGLSRLPDAEYLAAMQSINRAIQNPVFFMSFLGTLILLPLSAYWHYGQPVSMRFYLLFAATIFYVIGTFGVTVLGNVPLNEMLDALNLKSASPAEIASQREQFEVPWNSWHWVRSISSVLALIGVILACLADRKL